MGATVLVVDADKVFVGRLRTLLSVHGYSVLSASTIAGAMSILVDSQHRIQIVIIGLGFPDGTGVEVISKIARGKPHSKPKVVAVTDEVLESELHADRTIPKPGTDQHWLTAIAALLSGGAHAV